MTLTDKLAEMRKLAERASEGPWEFSRGDDDLFYVRNRSDRIANISPWDQATDLNDAEFIAQSRTLVPALLEALEAAVGALRVYADQELDDGMLEDAATRALAEMAKILQVSG